jgi:hypothetical protein
VFIRFWCLFWDWNQGERIWTDCNDLLSEAIRLRGSQTAGSCNLLNHRINPSRICELSSDPEYSSCQKVKSLAFQQIIMRFLPVDGVYFTGSTLFSRKSKIGPESLGGTDFFWVTQMQKSFTIRQFESARRKTQSTWRRNFLKVQIFGLCMFLAIFDRILCRPQDLSLIWHGTCKRNSWFSILLSMSGIFFLPWTVHAELHNFWISRSYHFCLFQLSLAWGLINRNSTLNYWVSANRHFRTCNALFF